MDVPIPCICPPDGARHPEGDTVVLRDTLDFRQAVTARKAVALAAELLDDGEGLPTEEVLAILTEQYVYLGIESWTLADDAGPVPVSRRTIAEHLLTRDDVAAEVADAADNLYSGKVLLPLLVRVSRSSRDTPTTGSMSPTTDSGPTSPTPASPSSISTIPTDGTAETSSPPAGDSRSSRKSASAA